MNEQVDAGNAAESDEETQSNYNIQRGRNRIKRKARKR